MARLRRAAAPKSAAESPVTRLRASKGAQTKEDAPIYDLPEDTDDDEPVRRLQSGKPLTQNAAIEPRRTTKTRSTILEEEVAAEEDEEVGDEDGSDQELSGPPENLDEGDEEEEGDEVDRSDFEPHIDPLANGHEVEEGEEVEGEGDVEDEEEQEAEVDEAEEDTGKEDEGEEEEEEDEEEEDEEEEDEEEEAIEGTEQTETSRAPYTPEPLESNPRPEREQSPDLGSKVTRPIKRSHKQNTAPRKRTRKIVEEEDAVEEESEGEKDEDEEQLAIQHQQQNGDEHDATIFVDPPDDFEDPVTVRLETKVLKSLLSQMKNRGWVHETGWVDEVLMHKDEDRETWFRRQKREVNTTVCLTLMKQLNDLWIICHRMPKAPELERQFQYLRREKGALGKFIKTTRRLVQAIVREIQGQKEPAEGDETRQRSATELKRARLLVKDLYRRVIPMLALLVKEVFILGGGSGPKRNRVPLDEVTLVASTFQILSQVQGWMSRLYFLMDHELDDNPLKPRTDSEYERSHLEISQKQRKYLAKPIDNLRRLVKQGADELNLLLHGPQMKAKAIEQDEALLMEREKKEEERQQAQERQMQLFIESTQRIRNGIGAAGSRYSGMRPAGSRLASHQAQPLLRRPAAPQDHVDDEYYNKHGGWYYEEDDYLLKMIRQILKPDYKALADLLPRRSPSEVEQRVGALRDRMRARYTRQQVDPPLWCYRHP